MGPHLSVMDTATGTPRNEFVSSSFNGAITFRSWIQYFGDVLRCSVHLLNGHPCHLLLISSLTDRVG